MPPSNLAASSHHSLPHLVPRRLLRVIILALACVVRIPAPARAFCTRAALRPGVAKLLSQRPQRCTGCVAVGSNLPLKFVSPRVPSKLSAVRDRSMSSSSVGGEGGYGGEEVVCVLEHVEDSYDGVIIDDKGLPADPVLFKTLLQDSMQQWRHRGKRGVWLKVPLKLAALVPVAADLGFVYHHAAPQHVMMTHWLSETPSSLPPGPSHQVGVGAIVLDGRGHILAVQERTGPLRGSGVWKMPTGLLDSNEDIGPGACREVLEETGVRAVFESVLAFRHAHAFAFNNSDLFFVAKLRPLSLELSACEREIEAVAWVPIHEFFTQPRFLSSPLYQHMYTLLSSHASPTPLLQPLIASCLDLGFKKGQGTIYHAPHHTTETTP